MTEREPFDSAWLKWCRAVVHAQTLHRDIERFAGDAHGKPFGAVSFDYQPKRRGFSVVVTEEPALPADWTLLLGDAVHDFRCALDHLTWALVQRGKTPNLTDDQKTKVLFPIANSASHFRALMPSRLPGVRRADLAVLRRYQPYRRGKTRVRWHCFTVLQSLSNDDKHREVKGIWMIPEKSDNELVAIEDCEVIIGYGFRALMKTDREISFIKVRKTGPNPKIQVSYKLTAYPAFDERLWLSHWLYVTTETIRRLLLDFSKPPNEVFDVGVDTSYMADAERFWLDMADAWTNAGKGMPGLASIR